MIFYLPLDGDVTALTRKGPVEAAAQVFDAGSFVEGIRAKAFRIAKPLTFDRFADFVNAEQGTFSVWISPDDWFSDAMMKTYATAPYRRGKVILTSDNTRAEGRVERDPSTALWAIQFNAAGTPQDREISLSAIWSGIYLPRKELSDWRPFSWHHVAVAWDTRKEGGGMIHLFVDGGVAVEQKFDKKLLPHWPIMYLGNARHGGVPFDGILDEVAIWLTPLSEEQIRKYYGDLKAMK